jgi:hypothetical protein
LPRTEKAPSVQPSAPRPKPNEAEWSVAERGGMLPERLDCAKAHVANAAKKVCKRAMPGAAGGHLRAQRELVCALQSRAWQSQRLPPYGRATGTS